MGEESVCILQPVSVKYPIRKRQRVRCFLSVVLLVLAGMAGSLFLLAPSLPLIFVNPPAFAFFINAAVHLWTMLVEVSILFISFRLHSSAFSFMRMQRINGFFRGVILLGPFGMTFI